MIVVEKNEGAKIPYTQNGTVVSFADGRLSLDCALYQKDWDVHLDVCENTDGNLVMGTESGQKYIAQLDIPAREYLYPEPAEAAPVIPADPADLADLDGEETETAAVEPEHTETEPPVALPLDMEKVTLSLWAIGV